MRHRVRAVQGLGWLGGAALLAMWARGHAPALVAAAARLRAAGGPGAAAFAAAYVVAVFSWLPAAPLTLAAGFVYGPLVGTLLVAPASVAGATLQCVALRRLGGRQLALWLLRDRPRAAALLALAGRHGLRAVLLLRLAPVVPFAAANALLALSPVPLRLYVLGSALGMLPATAAYVALGAGLPGLAAADLAGAPAVHGVRWAVAGAALLLAATLAWGARGALRAGLEAGGPAPPAGPAAGVGQPPAGAGAPPPPAR